MSYTNVKERIQFHEELRESVRNVCNKFPDAYWRALDARLAYPEEFVNEIINLDDDFDKYIKWVIENR